MNKIKIAFFGTPSFSVPVLESLINNYDVVLVVTKIDKPIGRSNELKPSIIKECALKHNIEVFTPNKLKEEFEYILTKDIDLIVTCAYGQILPKELLDYPKLGCINVHASLLPKLRGGAPIHHSIIQGHNKTGITIMYMNEGMDTGDIISQEETVINENDNTGIIHDKLSDLGAKLLIETLPSIINKTNQRIKQNENEATYAPNIKREDEHLNFNKTSLELYNQVRGLYPWPLANIILDDKEIKVLESRYEINNSDDKVGTIIDVNNDYLKIKTTDGSLLITKIKPFGKKEMSIKEYLNSKNKLDLIGKEVK